MGTMVSRHFAWPPPVQAHPRLLAGVLVYLAVVSTAVVSLGAPLLPTIARVDHVSLAASQWALTIALLVGAVATPLLGRLGDGAHRRSVTLCTVAAVAAGCVISALPFGFAVLLAGRALQGVGLAPVSLATAVARDDLPAERSRRSVVAVGITTAAGVGLGYPLAGALTYYIGMGAAFGAGAVLSFAGLAAAALSFAGLAAAALVLPPSPQRRGGVDLAGAALLAVGVAALLVGAAEGPTWGWTSTRVVTAGALAAVALAGWTAWELRAASPLVQLRLLRNRSVLAGNLTAQGCARRSSRASCR